MCDVLKNIQTYGTSLFLKGSAATEVYSTKISFKATMDRNFSYGRLILKKFELILRYSSIVLCHVKTEHTATILNRLGELVKRRTMQAFSNS